MTSPRQRAAPVIEHDADISRILATTSQTEGPGQHPPVLVLTIGLPGSGKSTFARRLAPQIDAVVLESDALRRLLFGEPSYSREESRRLFGALHAAARQLLRQGRNVIVDATSVRESDRRPLYALAEESGARLLQLRFAAPAGVIEERLRRREAGSGAGSSSAGVSVYRRMAALEEAPRREYWTIDSSDTTTSEAALSRVVEACRAEAGGIPGGTL